METTTIIAIIVGSLLVISTVLMAIFVKPVRRIEMSKTKRIAYVAVLSATCALFNVFTIGLSKSVFLSFMALPCFIAGYLFGYIEGFAVGFIGDFIGSLINPMGAYMPLIGIASGMWGFIPGVIFTCFKGGDNLKTVVSYFLCLIICTVFLNTFGLWLLYGLGKKTFWVYLWARLPFQTFITLINMFIALSVLTFLPHFVKNRK